VAPPTRATACDRDDGSIDRIDRSTPESIRFDSIRWIPFDGFRSMDSIRSRMMSMDAWVTARSGIDIDRMRMTSMDSIDRE